MSELTRTTRSNISDQQYIHGLKTGNNPITKKFFNEELHKMLTHIQYDLFGGRVCYEDLVSELYLFLSDNDWRKLDSFRGDNGCHLCTWLSAVSWRYFVRNYSKMTGNDFDLENRLHSKESTTEKNLEMTMDVRSTLAIMSNRRYAECLELLLIEGYSAEEVAMRWNMKASNVYNIKHRAIQQFISIYNDRK